MKPTSRHSKNNWRTRITQALSGTLLAFTLPTLFFATPAAAQSAVDQGVVTELLRSVVALQTEALQSGNRQILNQNQTLVNQVRDLMVALKTDAPLPDKYTGTESGVESGDSDQDPTLANRPAGTGEGDVAADAATTICPEISITKRELRDYVESTAPQTERESTLHAGSEIPAGLACLGEAILNQCETAMAPRTDGYTLYVTRDQSAHQNPIFGKNRCYIGLRATEKPDKVALCSLSGIANLPRDIDNVYNWSGMERFLGLTLPAYLADHAWPLQKRSPNGQESIARSHRNSDPIARLTSQIACNERPVATPREDAS